MNHRVPDLEDIKAEIGLEGLRKRDERFIVVYAREESGKFRKRKGTLYFYELDRPSLIYHHARQVRIKESLIFSGDVVEIPDSSMHYKPYRVRL